MTEPIVVSADVLMIPVDRKSSLCNTHRHC